ncbi:MAG: thiamine phosphate synthase [Opitutales bacterium]|nr:thiamine phosphate synthase [Opitutales bacterium]
MRLKQTGQLYGILDTGYVSPGDWRERAVALIEGGCDLLQVRAKKENSAQRQALLEAVLPLTKAADIPLIINDDVELAAHMPDVGLHVGQDDMDPREARRLLGPDALIGWSTHSREQARKAMELGDVLSYFAVGPLFATPTKPDYEPVGLDLARWVGEQRPQLPYFCIGGIKRSNLDEVLAIGVPNVVIVSDLLCADDPRAATESVKAGLSRHFQE